MSFLFAKSHSALAFIGACLLTTACGAAADRTDDSASANAIDTNTSLEAWSNKSSQVTPNVASFAPASGLTAGGTQIDIYGTNFVSGAAPYVGNQHCTNAKWFDSTHMSCTTPALAAGNWNVVITNPNQAWGAASAQYAVAAQATAPTNNMHLRGTNLVGMEGGYNFNQATGPVPNSDYPVHSTAVVDYLASRHVNVIRLLFSWERMQSSLGGPIPAATSGNYKSYFDDFKRIVDYATNTKGMNVIIEPWQAGTNGDVGGPSYRGNVVGNGVVTNAHFADFWAKMAAVYAGNAHVEIGLVNEPSNMSTMVWFSAAQAAINGIRGAGFKGEILVPGNGWTGAGSWNDAWYDTASPQRSNAYGWMNARGPGLPLLDPLNNITVGVHTYADTYAGGGTTEVISGTVTRDRVKVTVDWARANHLKVFVGEVGMYAGAANASANWSNFVSYLDQNQDVLEGFAWWGCGKPGWWDDVAASGGGHFSITPTNNYTTDTTNMNMIKSSLAE